MQGWSGNEILCSRLHGSSLWLLLAFTGEAVEVEVVLDWSCPAGLCCHTLIEAAVLSYAFS